MTPEEEKKKALMTNIGSDPYTFAKDQPERPKPLSTYRDPETSEFFGTFGYPNVPTLDPGEIAREKMRGQSKLSQLSSQPITQTQNLATQNNNSNALNNTSPSDNKKLANPNFLYAEDTERMNRLGGLKEMLRSPNPDINYSMMRDEKTGKSVVRETINGSGNNSAPTLERPFVSAKKFRQIIGWDKDDRPIYSTGVDEMNAANAGISSYNAEQMAGYNNRNNAWASENGTVPLQNAQTAESNANAQKLRTMGNGSGVDKDNYLKIINQVPYGDPEPGTGKQQFINEEQLYDISAGKFINPKRQQTGPQNDILTELNSGQKPQMIYEKYFSSMPHDQAIATLNSMPPGESRKQLAKLLNDRWSSGN